MFVPLLCALGMATLQGCGTTRMSDTVRTGTEQLLLSCAIEQAVNQLGFEVLDGKRIYLDTQYLKGATDENYIVSSLRQHLLANGCVLAPDMKDAEFVVEARALVGTNRQEVLLGVPSMNLPNVGLPGVPSQIPELALAKSTAQKGIAKIAVFAYHRETGRAIWQSGADPVASTAKDTWILGSGPWQRGTIYKETRFAGDRVQLPFRTEKEDERPATPLISVAAEQFFSNPDDATQIAGDERPPPGNPPAQAEKPEAGQTKQ
jgi:hypothetical protein